MSATTRLAQLKTIMTMEARASGTCSGSATATVTFTMLVSRAKRSMKFSMNSPKGCIAKKDTTISRTSPISSFTTCCVAMGTNKVMATRSSFSTMLMIL